MSRLRTSLIFLVLTTLTMATQCDKDYIEPVPKQVFREKVELMPAKKVYKENDTIWISFNTTDKTLYDTISNQRLVSNAIKFYFDLYLAAKFNTPTNPIGGFCDFIFPSNIPANNFPTSANNLARIEQGCNNSPNYNIKVGVVLKQKGTYFLGFPGYNKVMPCSNQVNPYPFSDVLFTLNLADVNKDIFLSLPATSRDRSTEDAVDRKLIYFLKVE